MHPSPHSPIHSLTHNAIPSRLYTRSLLSSSSQSSHQKRPSVRRQRQSTPRGSSRRRTRRHGDLGSRPPLKPRHSRPSLPLRNVSCIPHIAAYLRHRREALLSDGTATAYGLAAVFTPPAHRRKGYARHMLQLLHYVLALPDTMPLFPAEWGSPPATQGFGDARFSFLHSGIDCAFYANCTLGAGEGARVGWLPERRYTRLWRVDGGASQDDVDMLDADDVAALQPEYNELLASTITGPKNKFAIIPQM